MHKLQKCVPVTAIQLPIKHICVFIIIKLKVSLELHLPSRKDESRRTDCKILFRSDMRPCNHPQCEACSLTPVVYQPQLISPLRRKKNP
ncbi:hypothetical protein T4B_3801 [Trichinella pseudospiralis]|uniref:Uncharacterized protein n=1 Tax=Trichinella pseudospiralis TaxID=6337 RepID=A0A0V1EB40_TRIPS|nr:hypothetical protein T4A_3589 [Trichinella pseudospiralis]KRZ07718.1 hypothetical protein T4B_3801 [Trichinella pseudospiralis]